VVFRTKCSSCHTFGKGEHVGPDLKGVTDRRSRQWLVPWIRSSARVIRTGDPTGVELFRRFREQRMPDHDLTDDEIGALLDYLEADGPEADAKKAIRRADQATEDDVKAGERLFFGRTKLSSGGLACAACHSVSVYSQLGGTFAPDLSRAFSSYYDTALDQMLKAAVPARGSRLHSTSVTNEESFAVRAFLRAVSTSQARSTGTLARNTTGQTTPP
jgi:mono/diheme cytochrome c family protein